MELSLREAATLLGRSPRTLRGQLARGDIPGKKKGNRWVVPSDSLPLTEPQRRALQAKADEVRELVEQALPSRVARTRGKGGLSVADLDAFRHTLPVYVAVRARPDLAACADELEQALLELAEGCHHFHPEPKTQAFVAARAHLGRAVGRLLMSGPTPLPELESEWLAALEGEALPALSGLLRWVERLGRGRR